MEVIESGTGKSKRKLTALPVLVVLFVISYSMLTRLVIDQDRMIDAQRSLIHSLLKDNISLSKYRKHAAVLPKNSADQNDIKIEFETPALSASASVPSNQVPSSQAQAGQAKSGHSPSNQVQLDQFPSAQVLQHQAQPNQVQGPQASAKTDRKVRKSVKPAAPPAPLTDPLDTRRVKFSI